MALGVRVRFKAIDGSVHGERSIPQLPVRLGRNAMNDVPMTHPFVSDFHAVIEVVDGKLWVRDLNSRNGTFGSNATDRVPAGQPLPLSRNGSSVFVLGRAITVTVEPFEQDLSVGERVSQAQGSVLGNVAAFGGQPPLIPGGAGPRAPQNWSSGQVASLPPLSMDGGAPPVRPAFIPSPEIRVGAMSPPGSMNQGGMGGGAMSQALPSLQPLGYGAASGFGPSPGPDRARAPHAPAASPGAPGMPATSFLPMETDTLALLGLRELAASLVPGVPLASTGDVARLLTKLHDLVEVFCRCFVPLREGYAQFVSSADVRPGASQRSRSNSARSVQSARDPAALAAALLDWRSQDFDAVQAVEETLVDIIAHHAALIEGVMRGMEALLEELSPASIERSAGRFAAFGRYRALWQTFEERYETLAKETRRFDVVFGPEFATSYRDHLIRQTKPT